MQLHKQLHTKNQLGTNFKRILHGSQSVWILHLKSKKCWKGNVMRRQYLWKYQYLGEIKWNSFWQILIVIRIKFWQVVWLWHFIATIFTISKSESFSVSNLCERIPESPQLFQNFIVQIWSCFLQLLRVHLRPLKYSFSGTLPRPLFPVTRRQLHSGRESSQMLNRKICSAFVNKKARAPSCQVWFRNVIKATRIKICQVYS